MACSPAGWGFRVWWAFIRYWSCSRSYCFFMYFVLFLNIFILFLSSSYFLELKFSAGLGLLFSSAYSLAVLCNMVVSQISYQRHREVQMLGWIFFFPCWPCFARRTRLCLQTGRGVCVCVLSKEKGSFFLPLWGMELGVTSSSIKIILSISPWLFKIVRFTLISIAREISIWIPAKPWCEQRHYNEIKLDERLVYMGLFPYWLPVFTGIQTS